MQADLHEALFFLLLLIIKELLRVPLQSARIAATCTMKPRRATRFRDCSLLSCTVRVVAFSDIVGCECTLFYVFVKLFFLQIGNSFLLSF